MPNVIPYLNAPTPTTRTGWLALARWAVRLIRDYRAMGWREDNLVCDLAYYRDMAHRVTL